MHQCLRSFNVIYILSFLKQDLKIVKIKVVFFTIKKLTNQLLLMLSTLIQHEVLHCGNLETQIKV